MKGTEHPTYQNPTIAEAVCEIHISLGAERPWKPTFPGDLLKAVQDDYPAMEPVQEVGVQLEFGPTGVAQRVLPPRQRMRLKHRERNVLLQIAENVLTVNVLSPYPGWRSMKRDVLSTWKRAGSVLQPERITRIGLRYINRIPRTSAQPATQWLRPTEFVPAGVLTSAPGFFSRVEAGVGPTDRIIVTVGDEPPGEGSTTGTIIFDIDRISQRETVADEAVLSSEIDRLHNAVWDVFVSAMTEELENVLSRRPS